MTEALPPTRHILDEAPAEVLARLPRIGSVMIINSREAVTHERIGVIETIHRDGEHVACLGAAHDSRIHLPAIRSMAIDTSTVLREKPYPRVDFLDADGLTLFSAVSFAGLEPFLEALTGLRTEPDRNPARRPDFERGSEPSPDDPGLRLLNAVATSGEPVAIAVERPGFTQRWRGVVETIVPSMGFINVMVPDFHFHLRAGAVERWERSADADGVVLSALGKDGSPLGLTLHARSEAAFEAAG